MDCTIISRCSMFSDEIRKVIFMFDTEYGILANSNFLLHYGLDN